MLQGSTVTCSYKFLFVFVWVIAWVVASADFLHVASDLHSCFGHCPALNEMCSHWKPMPLWNQKKFIKKCSHVIPRMRNQACICVFVKECSEPKKQTTRYSHSLWFVLNTQWKLDVSSHKEVHKLILVWNHKSATPWSLLILKL